MKDATISRHRRPPFPAVSRHFRWPPSQPSALLALTAGDSFAQKKPRPGRSFGRRTDETESICHDIAIGPADAKVTIVEYASMTCGHCQKFATTVFPEFKTKYIDTGKVRFIMREFPLDNLAAAASMLARCAGGDKAFPMIETLLCQAGRLGVYQRQPSAEAVRYCQAGGLHPGKLR